MITEKESRPTGERGGNQISSTGSDSSAARGEIVIPDLPEGCDLLKAATEYARAGLYIVPTGAHHVKHPGSLVGSAWPQLSSDSPADAYSWFGEENPFPGRTVAGIALHAGRSGLVTFDVDIEDRDLLHPALARALAECAPPFQATRAGAQMRGHYLFAVPPGRTLGNGTGGLGKGWGEVRGLNGVIIVAPTAHPEQGGLYRWQRTGPVPVLPDYVAELLPEGSAGAEAATDAMVEALVQETVGAFAALGLSARAVDRYTEDVRAGGSRHDAATAAAAWIAEDALAGLYPAVVAWRALETRFRADIERDRGKRRHDRISDEWAGILRWAVGQARAKTAGEIAAIRDAGLSRTGRPGTLPVEMVPPPAPVPAVFSAPAQPAAPKTDGEPIEPAQPDPSAETRGGWAPVDLSALIGAERKPVVPELGRRHDGVGLLYRGREHAVASEPECGKTWFVLHIVADILKRDGRVTIIDFEDCAETFVDRLMTPAFGLMPHRLGPEQFHYVSPDAAPASPGEWQAACAFGEQAADLVVFDGMTEGLGLFGWDPLVQKDIAAWRGQLVKPLLKAGCAVLTTDHVPKDKDGRAARYAIGAQHKLAGLTGAMFVLRCVEPFGQGRVGKSALYVSKDRLGGLRRHGRPDDRDPQLSYMGLMVGDAESGNMDRLDVYAPSEDATASLLGDELPPGVTEAMVAAVVERVRSGEVLGQRITQTYVVAGLTGKNEARRNAIDTAVRRGLLAVRIEGRAALYSASAGPVDFVTASSSPLTLG